jgi:thiol-disulfide isomerase/thioredoxin
MSNFYKGGRELAYLEGQSRHAVQQKTTAIRQHLQTALQGSIIANAITFINPITLLRKLWKSKAILLLGIALLHMFSLSAQTPRKDSGADGLTTIKPLKIGDTIPESLWNMPIQVVNHSLGKNTITLNDYRDIKLIIIDFWATWCSPCIKSIMKLDSLQPLFKDELTVFATSYEDSSRINTFLKKQDIKLFSGVRTEYLKRYFPHKMIPHQVWIKNGKIVAITNGSEATKENIEKAMLNDSLKLITKNDVLDFSTFKYLTDFVDPKESVTFSTSTFSGGRRGLGSIISKTIFDNKMYVSYTNADPISMFLHTINQSNNKTIISSKSLLEIDKRPGMDAMYCYQLISNDTAKNFWIERVLNDLCLQFNVKIERKPVHRECIIIRHNKITKAKVVKSDEGKIQDFQDFITLLNFSVRWKKDQPLFVDESGFTGKVRTPYYKDLQWNLQKLNEVLEPYGLFATKELKDVEVLVLSDRTLSEILK